MKLISPRTIGRGKTRNSENTSRHGRVESSEELATYHSTFMNGRGAVGSTSTMAPFAYRLRDVDSEAGEHGDARMHFVLRQDQWERWLQTVFTLVLWISVLVLQISIF
jgi:hypothetical protein